jgi:Protein of unknown function (DUF2726)
VRGIVGGCVPAPQGLAPQRRALAAVCQACPQHLVLRGVPLADVLAVKRGFDAAPWRRRLRHLHYDFVVCAPDARMLAAIELLETTSTQQLRSQAQWLVQRASAAAGLRLLRWHSKALPELAEIRAAFGESEAVFFEDGASSANASWWPVVARESRKPAAD